MKNALHPNTPFGGYEEGALDRQHLLAGSLERIEQTYRDARASGMAEPVVICGDARDPALRRVAAARYGEDAADELIAHYRSRRETPTLHFAMPRSAAREVFAAWSPTGGRFVDSIPDGCYGVAVVLGGGNLYAFRQA